MWCLVFFDRTKNEDIFAQVTVKKIVNDVVRKFFTKKKSQHHCELALARFLKVAKSSFQFLV
jgi:TnpA family transposase